MTSDQDDPSANSPRTRTTLRTLGTGCASAARCRRGLAAPAVTMLTKWRRSIGFLLFVAGPTEPGRQVGYFLRSLRVQYISVSITICWRYGTASPPLFRRGRRGGSRHPCGGASRHPAAAAEP